jgi:hypothetical protein
MSENVKLLLESEDYHAHCYRCLTTINLGMYPHRRGVMMVGWIFLCDKCAEHVAGTDLMPVVEVSYDQDPT